MRSGAAPRSRRRSPKPWGRPVDEAAVLPSLRLAFVGHAPRCRTGPTEIPIGSARSSVIADPARRQLGNAARGGPERQRAGQADEGQLSQGTQRTSSMTRPCPSSELVLVTLGVYTALSRIRNRGEQRLPLERGGGDEVSELLQLEQDAS